MRASTSNWQSFAAPPTDDGAYEAPVRSNGFTLRRWVFYLPHKPLPVWQGQLLALACVVGATVLRSLLDPLVDDRIPFIALFPAVLIASVWGGGLAGTSTLLLGALVAAYVWLSPAGAVGLTAASWTSVTAFAASASVLIAIAALLRALVEAHAEAEERATILAREMRHRIGNVLGVVQAISGQTARGARTVEEHQALFGARLMALGRAQELVARTPKFPPSLEELIDRILEPFGRDRFAISGPRIGVRHELATSLALLVHELGTNAVKHGALSVPAGRVTITWVSAEKDARLEWQESGGPRVAPPSRKGFGSRLMRTTFAPGQGEVLTEFDPAGFRCVVQFPAVAEPAAKSAIPLQNKPVSA